jgi:hypothetical protein
MLRRPGGPTYHVILDELAVRRPTAPLEIMKAQLYHVAATVNGNDNITAQVLPVTAAIESYRVPRSAFSLYTFSDPDDPTIVAVDTVTDDIVITEDGSVKLYDELFNRLAAAALGVEESLEFLIATAKAGQTGW